MLYVIQLYHFQRSVHHPPHSQLAYKDLLIQIHLNFKARQQTQTLGWVLGACKSNRVGRQVEHLLAMYFLMTIAMIVMEE